MVKFYWSLVLDVLLALCVPAARAQFHQQVPKLVGTGAVGFAHQGVSVAVSADGNTMIVGGPRDNYPNGSGAAWVFTRSGGVWTQQGDKLVSSGITDDIQGVSVALSADGNTALVGGANDDNGIGDAWVFVRSGGVWTQQGSQLAPTGVTPPQFYQGVSVALSADGNTALLGGPGDNGGIGAVWVFTRSGGVWSQQGSKLVGTGWTGGLFNTHQGTSVALSADGSTALVGGPGDNTGIGAVWVFTRSGGVWSQQGAKLIGSGYIGIGAPGPVGAWQGASVSLSADGNTALVGGSLDYTPDYYFRVGAAWVFTRSAGVWSQQGGKLVGSGYIGSSGQGTSVSLSGDGNTALVGGPADNPDPVNYIGAGATWVFTRSNNVWTQQGAKLIGSGAAGNASQGSVALSSDGSTAIVGGPADNQGAGATWVFVSCNFSLQPPTALVPSAGGGGTVSVTPAIPSGCSWSATSNAPWLTINGGFGGVDSGTVSYLVTANPTPLPRTGTLTIDDQIFTVIQQPPVATNNEAFVRQLYLDLLNRPIDNAGFQWVTWLNNGTYTRAQVAPQFFQSQEFYGTGNYITKLYLALMLRDPDYGGWTGWFNDLRNGWSQTDILNQFLLSPEFQSRYGNLDNTAFITLLYNNILNRPPDQAGLNQWVAWLNNGTYTRSQVANNFVISQEFQLRMGNRIYVDMLYIGFLRRAGDPNGLDGWTNWLTNGTYTLDQEVGYFISSPEYLSRF